MLHSLTSQPIFPLPDVEQSPHRPILEHYSPHRAAPPPVLGWSRKARVCEKRESDYQIAIEDLMNRAIYAPGRSAAAGLAASAPSLRGEPLHPTIISFSFNEDSAADDDSKAPRMFGPGIRTVD